jgi:hypothetical protein
MMNAFDQLQIAAPEPKPGQVQLPDGRIVDRAKVCFRLVADQRDPAILYASDRDYKNVGGTLKRLIAKETRQQRKERKKNRG